MSKHTRRDVAATVTTVALGVGAALLAAFVFVKVYRATGDLRVTVVSVGGALVLVLSAVAGFVTAAWVRGRRQ